VVRIIYFFSELLIIEAMAQTNVMTEKERKNGELERHQTIQSLLVEIRILNRFAGRKMIDDKIAKKQALLNDLWCSGDDKYTYDVQGHNTKP
jgi:flagellar biosynthesis/type III secretory pathway chaperone